MKRLLLCAFVLALVGAAVASIDGSTEVDDVDIVMSSMPLTAGMQ